MDIVFAHYSVSLSTNYSRPCQGFQIQVASIGATDMAVGWRTAISYQANPRRSSTLMLASLMSHDHTVMVQAIPDLANSFTTMVWKPNAFRLDIQVSATDTSG